MLDPFMSTPVLSPAERSIFVSNCFKQALEHIRLEMAQMQPAKALLGRLWERILEKIGGPAATPSIAIAHLQKIIQDITQNREITAVHVQTIAHIREKAEKDPVLRNKGIYRDADRIMGWVLALQYAQMPEDMSDVPPQKCRNVGEMLERKEEEKRAMDADHVVIWALKGWGHVVYDHPEQVSYWRWGGFEDPVIALTYFEQDLRPKEAYGWYAAGYSAEQAIRLKAEGYTPEDAQDKEQGMLQTAA